MISLLKSSTQPIEKEVVWSAFKKVKSNGGSAGVDGVSNEMDESGARKYLYILYGTVLGTSINVFQTYLCIGRMVFTRRVPFRRYI